MCLDSVIRIKTSLFLAARTYVHNDLYKHIRTYVAKFIVFHILLLCTEILETLSSSSPIPVMTTTFTTTQTISTVSTTVTVSQQLTTSTTAHHSSSVRPTTTSDNSITQPQLRQGMLTV